MREEDLMRLLAGLGGVLTLIETLLGLNERNYDTSKILLIVISIVLAVIIIILGLFAKETIFCIIICRVILL